LEERNVTAVTARTGAVTAVAEGLIVLKTKEKAMDETYRMLGREHQADLEREAQRRHLAATARAGRPVPVPTSAKRQRREWLHFLPSRLAALRAARP
jgi:hypothetical protein